jgi:hypothetical protein
MLFEQKRVDLYDLYLIYRLSPAQVAMSINKFQQMGIIIYESNNIELSDYGQDWLISNRKKIFLQPKNKFWKKIPSAMLENAIVINQPFFPSRKISKEILGK